MRICHAGSRFDINYSCLGLCGGIVNWRRQQSHFSNARSVRNAIDRIKLAISPVDGTLLGNLPMIEIEAVRRAFLWQLPRLPPPSRRTLAGKISHKLRRWLFVSTLAPAIIDRGAHT